MTVVKYNEIGIAIRDHLKDNIADPLGTTPKRIWVHYDDPTNEKDISRTPAIFVQAFPSDSYFRSVGGGNEWLLEYGLHIIVGDFDKGYIAGVPTTNNKELLDDLFGLVEEQMKSFTNANVQNVIALSLGGHIPLGEKLTSYLQTWGVMPK